MIFCLLQELHLNGENTHLWSCEWGKRAFFSPGKSNARGVGILINSNANIVIKKEIIDKNGRVVILVLTIEDIDYVIGNIYAPNSDDPKFFKHVFNKVEAIGCENVILAGDFNLVLNIDKDAKNRLSNNYKACETVKNYMEQLGLIDVWRVYNEETFSYTWKRGSPATYSRLDMFLVSGSIVTQCSKLLS